VSRQRPATHRGGNSRAGSAVSESGLSADQIVEAALDLIEANGLEGLSMRALSDKLGVALGATYRHVRSKHALLALVVNELHLRVEPAGPETGDWSARIRSEFVGIATELGKYPGVAAYAGSRLEEFYPKEMGDRIFALLIEAGFDEALAIHAMTTLILYVTGFMLASPAVIQHGGNEPFKTLTAGLDIILEGLRVELSKKVVAPKMR
jgi:TetR/AcrR family transcriptional regulator, tetracycline repressor protein